MSTAQRILNVYVFDRVVSMGLQAPGSEGYSSHLWLCHNSQVIHYGRFSIFLRNKFHLGVDMDTSAQHGQLGLLKRLQFLIPITCYYTTVHLGANSRRPATAGRAGPRPGGCRPEGYPVFIHSYYKSFVDQMWEQMSTKPPIVPLFLTIASLFTYNGPLGFRFWVHQTKLRGAKPVLKSCVQIC